MNAAQQEQQAAQQQQQAEYDSLMGISRPEHSRALEIKAAVEQDERCRNLSDFEYVQWALTTLDSPLIEIVERVYMMQCFRDEYKLQDTMEEAADILAQFGMIQQPGALLSFDYLPSSKNYVLVNDVARFFPGRVQSQEDFRIYLGMNFYMFQAGAPFFAAQRAGLTVVLECMDATLEDNFDHRMQERFMQEFMMFYPKRDKEYYFVNSPMVISFIYGVLKPFIPERDRKAYKLGHKIPGFDNGQRLDALYLQPNPMQAITRTVKKMCETLVLRYKNQQEFSLSNCRIRDP